MLYGFCSLLLLHLILIFSNCFAFIPPDAFRSLSGLIRHIYSYVCQGHQRFILIRQAGKLYLCSLLSRVPKNLTLTIEISKDHVYANTHLRSLTDRGLIRKCYRYSSELAVTELPYQSHRFSDINLEFLAPAHRPVMFGEIQHVCSQAELW